MSRIFQEDGTVVPVTLVKCETNVVYSLKNKSKDGHDACVLATAPEKHPTKTKKFRIIKEFALFGEDKNKGDEVSVSDFKDVKFVSIIGISKGKGFQGVIKRHKFSRGPTTHGSDHHRAPGSIGANAMPGRVIKGKKLPGRMGTDKITLKKIEVVKIYPEDNLIALKGSLPGARNTIIQIIVTK